MVLTVRMLRTVLYVCSMVMVFSACVAGQAEREEDTKCFSGLGCFSTNQGLPKLPLDPDVISTVFLLYTRHNRYSPVEVNATMEESEWRSLLNDSSFNSHRHTKVITHGWSDAGTNSWVQEMKNELLKKGDFNVIVVNWRHGAAAMIDVAAANTFVVAVQLARFLQVLHLEIGITPDTVHLIGHSFGAHISGNAAHKTRGIGRVTGLDPAEPFFIHFDNSMRLDKSDAAFVDILHTDSEKFDLSKGYGLIDPLGHVDFYPNGGIDQPGCVDDVLAGILGLLTGGNGIQCSHLRSNAYFTESINSRCKFRARLCGDWPTYERGDCHTCPPDGCPIMGYDADQTSARGSFYLTTTSSSPFCGREYHVQVQLSDNPINAVGRLNITLLGDHDSQEGEFSRDNERFHPNDTLSHVIGVNQLQGAVQGVRLKYHRYSGDPHVYVKRVLVEDLDTETRVVVCAQDVELRADHPVDFTSRTGC